MVGVEASPRTARRLTFAPVVAAGRRMPRAPVYWPKKAIKRWMNFPEAEPNRLTRKWGDWREGVGVEPTRDVYSPILDLKSRGFTGTPTLPFEE